MLVYNAAKVFERINLSFENYLKLFSSQNLVNNKPYIDLDKYIFRPVNKAHTGLASKLNTTKITYPFCNYYYSTPMKQTEAYNSFSRINNGFITKPLTIDDKSVYSIKMIAYEIFYQVDFWFEKRTEAMEFKALFDFYLKLNRYIETDYTTVAEDDSRLFEKIPSDIFIDDFSDNSDLVEQEDEQGKIQRLTYSLRLSPVWLFNTPTTLGLIKKIIIEFYKKYDTDKYNEDIIIE